MKKMLLIIGGIFFVFVLFGIMGTMASQKGCSGDWKQCANNADLMNNWTGRFGVMVACKYRANDMAKYGDPEWPSTFFRGYYSGDSYIKTGHALLVEKEARFTNGFNAKARTQLMCLYDLNEKKVIDMKIG